MNLETLVSHAPKTSFQQALAAVAIPLMPIVQFPEPLTTILYWPLAMQKLSYCLDLKAHPIFPAQA